MAIVTLTVNAQVYIDSLDIFLIPSIEVGLVLKSFFRMIKRDYKDKQRVLSYSSGKAY